MSSKSKLKFALLAATAVFLFNPGLMPKAFQTDSELRAQGLSLPLGGPSLGDPSDASDLLMVSTPPSTAANDANAAFAPPSATMAAPPAAAVAVNPQAAPGDNPFIRQAKPAVAPAGTMTPSVAVAPAAAIAPAAPVATNPFAKPETATAATADSRPAVATTVDIGALRYYASTQDLKRVGAELRRLKDLYPNWQPPKDLFTPVSIVDEQPLWTIYATGNYAAVRASIARAQSVNPKWQPSEDLLLKLQMGETRSLIASSYAQQRWADVLSTAQAMPSIMVCGEMQVQWSVAEAFARMRNFADAFDVYSYILTSCDDPAMRLATVQKASLLIPSVGFQSLLALGGTTQDGHPEFENIGFDGIRRQIGAYIEHGDFSDTPSSEEITRFVDFVQRNASVEDANLIGWYFYSQKEWESANAWFLQASKFKRDPKSIEGVILTLRQMDKTEEALKIARHYVKMSPDVARQYVEIVASEMTSDKATLKLDADDADLFETTVTDLKSALGAQALGWQSLASSDKLAAKTWFSNSVEWAPTEGGVVGLAVIATRAKNIAALNALKTKYGKTYASLQDFKIYTARAKPSAKPRAPVKVDANRPKTLADYFKSDS